MLLSATALVEVHKVDIKGANKDGKDALVFAVTSNSVVSGEIVNMLLKGMGRYVKYIIIYLFNFII